jgi:Caspase domain
MQRVQIFHYFSSAYNVTTRKVALKLDKYSCTHRRRGRCVIINQHHFNEKLTGQKDRHGTDVDATKTLDVFERLGFEVARFDDLTAEDMLFSLKKGES